MDMEITGHIPRESWLRAMGASDMQDSSIMKMMDEAENIIFEAAEPKAIYRIMDIREIKISGYSLARHLTGCGSVAVMALTLGIGVDNVIRKLQVTDMAKAVTADSGASILTEQLCDRFEEHIRYNVKGYMTCRFSPGYGDSPLEMQKDIILYVDAWRKIGLNITSSYLMVPRKSVTAVMGISEYPVTGRLATCDECILKDKCTLRKEGKFCGD